MKLVVGSTTKQTVTDKEQKGNLTVYKEGEVFVGAVSDENGTSFQYEKRRQKGAVYNVYAAEDIVTAGGKTTIVNELKKQIPNTKGRNRGRKTDFSDKM